MMTREIGAELGRIAEALSMVSSSSRVVAERDGVAARSSLGEWIPGFLHRLFLPAFGEENRRTIAFFYQLFGKQRVIDISKRYGLRIEERCESGEALYRRDIEQLFVGVGDIRSEDMAHLFAEIKKSPNQVRHLSEVESRALYMQLLGKRQVSDLTKCDYDEFYKVLIPFSKVEHIFLNHCPKVDQYSAMDGSFPAVRNRVFVTEEMRRDDRLLNDDLFWHVRFSKRITDEDLPLGIIVPHAQGYYEFQKMIEGKGVFKLAFKAVTETSDRFRSILAYLSTRSELEWHTIPSLMQTTFRDIAVQGTTATYEATKAYFDDPDHKEPHWLVGYSMGGTAMQRDACLFSNRVVRLTTLCSPGVDKMTHRWFAERVNKGISSFQIRHIVEDQDPVSCIGDGQLGIGCDPRLARVEYVTLMPQEPGRSRPIERPSIPKAPRSLFGAYYQFFVKALLPIHSRETTARPHWVFKSDNQLCDIDRLLDNTQPRDKALWEYWRHCVYQGKSRDFVHFLKAKRPAPGLQHG